MSIGNRPPRNGDLPNSGNPKSAVVKTINFPVLQAAPLGRFPFQSLLCRRLRSPIELSISTNDRQLSGIWRTARLLTEQDRPADAISSLVESLRREELPASGRIPTLFLLAQLQIEIGDSISAERFIQQGLRDFGEQVPSDGSFRDNLRSNCSTESKFQPFALGGREWLTLAIQSLYNRDLESCLRWIHQANQQVRHFETVRLSRTEFRLTGDLHAVLACAMTQIGDFEEAEKCLSTSFTSHLKAESFESACRDLILTSRLAAAQGQADRANSLLDAAECQIIMTVNQDSVAGVKLSDIVYNDRYADTDARRMA